METALRYDRAAPGWGARVTRLGYGRAYGRFLRDRTVAAGPVLDVGTGDGLFALSWLAAGGSADLTLLDPSPAMLAQARARFLRGPCMPRLVAARLEAFRPDRPWAAILAAHVLEHVDDAGEALGRMAGWLEPGGRLVLVVSKPHWCNWLIWLRFRHRWFGEAQVRRLAREAGLVHLLTHRFDSGPPSRTSLGYIFTRG